MKKMLRQADFHAELTRLFLQEGVRDLTVGEIAARLRCSRRRLYELADSKDTLFQRVVGDFFDQVLAEGEEQIRDETDLVAALTAYFDVGLHAGAKMSPAFLRDVEARESTCALFDHLQQARIATICKITDRGIEQGLFVGCNGKVLYEIIAGAALRLRGPGVLDRLGVTMEEAADQLYHLLFGGLLSDQARKEHRLDRPAVSTVGLRRARSPGLRG